MAKRYELGVLDKYPMAVMGTSIEDSPTNGVILDENVDGERLRDALDKTLELFPLFKTKIVFDRGYFLEENNNPVLIFNEDDYHKAFTWKTGTNEYPWKLSCYQNRIILRWCHGVTDGRGAGKFLGTLLNIYYGVPCSVEPALELGLEPFADKTEKGIPQKKQPKGFGTTALKLNRPNDCTQFHVLKCRTADVLALAKRSDASPATVIPPLFAMALRKCMKKKKNVKCSIVVDARGPLGHQTMHNCIFTKEITYVDRFDELSFELVSTIYRAILNLACERENVVVEATNSVNLIGTIVNSRCKALIRLGGRLCSWFMKSTTSDVTYSYLGKVDYGPEVNRHLLGHIGMSWTDFGYCNIISEDFNGEFTMMINEAYQDKNVIPQFISTAGELGLEITEVDSFPYCRADK